MTRALFINAATQEITEFDHQHWKDIADKVGMMGLAARFKNGDIMYVDDEGFLKPQAHFVKVPEGEQPYAGNAVVVGPDEFKYVTLGDGTEDLQEKVLDAVTSVEEMREKTRFLTYDQMQAWGKANASDIGFSVTTVDATGRSCTRVHSRMGELVASIPRAEDPQP